VRDRRNIKLSEKAQIIHLKIRRYSKFTTFYDALYLETPIAWLLSAHRPHLIISLQEPACETVAILGITVISQLPPTKEKKVRREQSL
jgi:hypothetical protein